MILHKILTNHQRLHNLTAATTTYKSLTSNVRDDDKFSRICDATLQKLPSNNKACESCEKTKCFLFRSFCFVSLILSFFLASISIFVLRGEKKLKILIILNTRNENMCCTESVQLGIWYAVCANAIWLRCFVCSSCFRRYSTQPYSHTVHPQPKRLFFCDVSNVINFQFFFAGMGGAYVDAITIKYHQITI